MKNILGEGRIFKKIMQIILSLIRFKKQKGHIIKDLFEEILRVKEKTCRKRTITAYRSAAKSFIEYLRFIELEGIPVKDINSRIAIQYGDFLKTEKNFSNSSHNCTIEHLRGLFQEIQRREYIEKNPFMQFKFLAKEKQTVFAFSDSEVKLLKNYCLKHDKTLWLICQFIYYCAIRPNELVQLRITYIDLHHGNILIPAEVAKNKRQAMVFIPNAFLHDLKKLKLERINPDYYLFSTSLQPGLNKIHPNRLSERYRKVAQELGLKRRMYDLKHTGAGRAINAGANIKDLQLHLRHSDIQTTDLYLRAFKSEPSKDFRDKFPPL